MENEFLHNIDLKALQAETGMTVKEIADLIGINTPTIYKWNWSKAQGGCRPTFNAIIELIKAGATTRTLLGIDCQLPIQKVAGKDETPEEFADRVRHALQMILREKEN